MNSISRILALWVQAVAKVFDGVGRTMAEALGTLARVISVLPTTVADVLYPVVTASVTFGPPAPKGDFERRIAEITEQLNRSGSEAQALLDELRGVIEARQQQMMDAQGRLLALQLEESEVEERVSMLKAVQPEAATAITALLGESLEERDKRSSRRDWLIFGMGVAASAVISVVVAVAFEIF